MRTVKQCLKQSLMLLFFITISLGYNLVVAETTEAPAAGEHEAHNKMDWPGIYQGFTPCADCMGVKTELALNTNSSYILITQFVGKSVREFVEKGKFTWDSKSKTVALTPRKSTTVHHYLVGQNTLTQLDDKGNPITGENAARYVLRRNDVTKAPEAHSGH
ncbi:MAG: copper resistance protein NlpE [Methylococcales bacterium]